MSAEVAIVGAGISGLSAGYHLMRAGLRPVIFEKASFVGGRMSSEELDGFVIEKAAYTFPEFHKNLIKLLRELKLGHCLVQTSGTSSTFSGSTEYQIKIGSPGDFLRYKLLSLRNKKDMVQLFLRAQSLGKALNLNNPSAKTFELERQSAAEYLLNNYDKEIIEKIAYPIFCEIFLGTPESNSELAFLATIKNLTRFKIFAFNRGMGLLPARLAQDLDVRLNTPVLEVSRGAGGGSPYELQIGGDAPATLPFDAVIFAIPAPEVPALCPEIPVSFQEGLRNITYAPSIVLALTLEKRYPGASMINNVLRQDLKTLGTVVFDHHKSPEHVPSGEGLVTVILAEPASREFLAASDDAVVRAALPELEGLFPGLPDTIGNTRVYRWEYGAVQLEPGSVRRTHVLRRALEEEFDNLFIAGDGLYKSSLEISHNTGIKAAHHILKHFRAER